MCVCVCVCECVCMSTADIQQLTTAASLLQLTVHWEYGLETLPLR